MVTGIGSISSARSVDVQGGVAQRAAADSVAPAPAEPQPEAIDTPRNPATALAAQGAPIDTDKIAAIRAGIADGTYKVDPKAIASAMLAQIMPVQA